MKAYIPAPLDWFAIIQYTLQAPVPVTLPLAAFSQKALARLSSPKETAPLRPSAAKRVSVWEGLVAEWMSGL